MLYPIVKTSMEPCHFPCAFGGQWVLIFGKLSTLTSKDHSVSSPLAARRRLWSRRDGGGSTSPH